MIYFFDTSSLVKRYHEEFGTQKINEIFLEPASQVVISSFTISETVSTLNKFKNINVITSKEMDMCLIRFFFDLKNVNFGIIHIRYEHIIKSVELIPKYNLKSSDAVILACALDLLPFNPIFVCSDKKLLNAANLEKLNVFNPEE